MLQPLPLGSLGSFLDNCPDVLFSPSDASIVLAGHLRDWGGLAVAGNGRFAKLARQLTNIGQQLLIYINGNKISSRPSYDNMVQFTILGGGYTGYITSYLFNAVTLSLTLQGRFPSGNNPSWIATNLRRDVL